MLAVPEMGAQTLVRRGVPAALPSGLDARSLSPIKETGRPGHATPFIARQTRAYLNFEVKDGAPISAVAEMGIYDVEIGQVRFRWRAAYGGHDP